MANETYSMQNQVLVNRPMIDFTASAVMGDGKVVDNFCLSEFIAGKAAWLVFYPLDFTFVCPSELVALNNHMDDFTKRGVEVIGISIDSQYTHAAWRNMPTNKGGVGQLKYPLVADISHSICRAYGVEHPEASVALRGTFLIDSSGIIQAQIVNNLPLGRNVGEMLRTVDAMQFHEANGEVCPANWQQGDQGMVASTEGVAKYLQSHADKL